MSSVFCLQIFELSNIQWCFMYSQAYISTQQLRLIASMFVDEQYPGLANYEKVLSFIGSSLKERVESGAITNR